MSIPAVQGHPLFTQALQYKWDEFNQINPTGFLRSFFKKNTTTAKEVSVAVRRGTQKVAVDIVRGSEGNRNEIRKHNLKIYVPPLFKEYFDATDIDHYDFMFGALQTGASNNQVAQAVRSAMEQTKPLKDKIERAYELQASQVFFDGIVELKNGDNIDYNRDADSFVVKEAGEYWTVDTVDPGKDLQTGAKFIKTKGRTSAGTFNVILGADALEAYLNNPLVQKRADNRRIDRMNIGMPEEVGDGAIFHGQDSYGDYKFNLWSYPQYYTNSNGVETPYVPADKFVMLPTSGAELLLSYAGVPHLVQTGNVAMPQVIQNIEGDYHMFSTVDDRAVKHEFGVQSAGLCVPVTIDMLYSGTVTNGGAVQG